MDQSTIGRYRLIEEIGRGGMAVVYRGYDPRFKRDVAVKVMTQDMLHDDKLIARFEREAQTIAALEHPSIVPVYDFGEEKGRPFLVMRLMTGGTLADQLRQGPLSIDYTVRVLQRIGSALERAHQKGIVHRDLKPTNIMFDDYGDAFLADFGIARLTESAVTLTGEAVIGTPAYMSPEQIHGDRDIDGRSDIYALGIICFEMLTGRRPYEDKTAARIMMKHIMDPVPDINAVRPDLPPGVAAAIARTLAKDPGQRYATASQLPDTLQAIALGGTPPPTPPSQPPTTEEAHPATEVITPSFVGRAAPDTEVMAPTPPEAAARPTTPAPTTSPPPTPPPATARPTPAPAAAQPARPAGSRRWLFIGLGAVVLLFIVIAGLVGGGIFLASRGSDEGEADQAEEATTVIERPAGTAEAEAPPPTVEEVQPEATAPPQADPEEIMNTFYEYLDQGDYDAALEAVDEAIALDPENAWYYHERTAPLMEMGEYLKALAAIERAIDLDDQFADLYTRRGQILRELDDMDAALADQQRAIELDPYNAYLHAELGISYYSNGDYDNALEMLDRAIKLESDVGWYHNYKADVYRDMGDMDSAISEANQAILIDPSDPWGYNILAQIYGWYFEDWDKAIDYYGQAISVKPDNPNFYNERAIFKRHAGRIDEALADHDQAIAMAPDESWLIIERGYTNWEGAGDMEAALDDFSRAIEVEPENAEGYKVRANLLHWEFDDPEAAVDDLDRCIELDPEYYWCIYDRAWALSDLDKSDAAVADFERFLELLPEDECSDCVIDANNYINEHR